MKKNSVLQALAAKMKALRHEDPELFQAMAEQSAQMQILCSMSSHFGMRKAIDRINLTSAINNLN